MNNYFYNEKFEFLVVESFENRCYGFNLNRAAKHDIAKKIIQDLNNFIVNGWKIAGHIPKWVHGYDAWNDFMNDKYSGNNSDSDSKKDYDNKDSECEDDEEEEDNEKFYEDEKGQEYEVGGN
jgi:hypothetical protein